MAPNLHTDEVAPVWSVQQDSHLPWWASTVILDSLWVMVGSGARIPIFSPQLGEENRKPDVHRSMTLSAGQNLQAHTDGTQIWPYPYPLCHSQGFPCSFTTLRDVFLDDCKMRIKKKKNKYRAQSFTSMVNAVQGWWEPELWTDGHTGSLLYTNREQFDPCLMCWALDIGSERIIYVSREVCAWRRRRDRGCVIMCVRNYVLVYL